MPQDVRLVFALGLACWPARRRSSGARGRRCGCRRGRCRRWGSGRVCRRIRQRTTLRHGAVYHGRCSGRGRGRVVRSRRTLRHRRCGVVLWSGLVRRRLRGAAWGDTWRGVRRRSRRSVHRAASHRRRGSHATLGADAAACGWGCRLLGACGKSDAGRGENGRLCELHEVPPSLRQG